MENELKEKNDSSTILVVDDEESVCITLRELLKREFSVLIANSAKSALDLVQNNSNNGASKIDLVLTDISMAKMDGVELLKRIKQKNPQIEVILITGHPSSETTLAALKLGATDYIIKPFRTVEVLESIHKAMKKRKDYVRVKSMIDELQTAVRKNYSATTNALILTIDAKDHYTKEHCARVAAYSVLVAEKVGLDKDEQETLRKVAIIHDIGKIGVREDVLNKQGPLTPSEKEEMEHHSFIGYQIVQPIEFLGSAREILLYHQERYDGKGYPGGLEGEQIPLGARILAIADTYDAMTTDRPYRKALSVDVAISELEKGKGTQFDPKLVDVFVHIIKETESKKKGDV